MRESPSNFRVAGNPFPLMPVDLHIFGTNLGGSNVRVPPLRRKSPTSLQRGSPGRLSSEAGKSQGQTKRGKKAVGILQGG
jgi:hypothetical protein